MNKKEGFSPEEAVKKVIEEAEKAAEENEKSNENKEIPPEWEVEFLIDNYGSKERDKNEDFGRLKYLLLENPGLIKNCIEKLDGEGGDIKIKKDIMNNLRTPAEERGKAQMEMQNKTKLLEFLKSLTN